jgi:urease accessory protein
MEAMATQVRTGRGEASLVIESVGGQSAVTSAVARSPLKLLTPCARGSSVWACTSSFGGGMVAGDETRLHLRLGANTRCFLGTQASTKIYRNPNQLPCGHITQATMDKASVLVFMPDPVQAFAGSSYSQRQQFHLSEGAGLVLLDWFTSGRAARGERWQFSWFRSRNDVFLGDERIFLDSIALDSADGPVGSPMRGGRFNCFAMLLLAGDPLRAAASGLVQEIATQPVNGAAPVVTSASPLHHGAVLRLAGEQVEAVKREVHRLLAFLRGLLGNDPWERKW